MSARASVLFVGNFLSATALNRGYSEELADRLEVRGWNVIRTSSQLGRAARLADMLHTTWTQRRAYSLAHVDVFSGPAFVWAEAVCFALRALRKPYVLTLHGGNLPEFAQRWPKRVRRLLRSAALVTVPSPYLGERMQIYRRDLVLLPNAIDASAYVFTHRVRARPRLTWVRAFHSIYNPVLAIEVLAQLSKRHPDSSLTMLGPDKDGSRADVERRAIELGVRDRLTLVGRVPKSEIPRHLASADLFINTTDIDNTPVSVLEAMAAGLCVVSTSVGGIPFLLHHDHDALLVPPRDARAMTAALERLIDDAGLASRLSRAAHEVAQDCDWAIVLEQWEQTFDGIRLRV